MIYRPLHIAAAGLVIEGYTDYEIARALGIGYWSARSITGALARSFRVRRRAALAASIAYLDAQWSAADEMRLRQACQVHGDKAGQSVGEAQV